VNHQGHQAYKDNEVSTGSNLKLVMLMYDGVIRFLKECKNKIEENDIAGRGIYLSKAQQIINELQGSLNSQKGGEVAEQLEKVYSLVISKLTQANISGDVELVDQSIQILEELRLAWSQIKPDNNLPMTQGSTAPKVVISY